MPIFDPDGKCPLLNKKCIKHQCVWYNMLQGQHPQTGEPVHEWGCSVAWLPLLMVNIDRGIAGTTAATESFRNEMVKANMVTASIAAKTIKRAKSDEDTIFGMIASHQDAVANNDEMKSKSYIRHLSNNKVKTKERSEKERKAKKVKNNGNNIK